MIDDYVTPTFVEMEAIIMGMMGRDSIVEAIRN